MYDAAIIGTGPAGLSAAINLRQLGKSVLWFGSAALSDKVQRSEMVANYPGVSAIPGEELNRRFLEQARAMELTITDKMVTSITALRNRFVLLAQDELFEAETVLLATGVTPEKGFDGEAALLGKGVSYCATCDGFLYKGKTIAIFCGAKRFEHEAAYLAELAQKAYLFPAYNDCAIDIPHVERLTKPIRAVSGEKRVTGVTLADGSELAADALFCLRGAVAPTTLMPGIKTEGAHIEVDCAMQTNIPGCFAAGDCTGRPYQIAKAVGEGNIAAHGMAAYLAGKNK